MSQTQLCVSQMRSTFTSAMLKALKLDIKGQKHVPKRTCRDV